MVRVYKKLIGDKCWLVPIDGKEDAPLYTQWLNDMEVSIHLTLASQQITMAKEEDILARMSKEGEYIFGIVAKDSEKLIGNCGLMQLDWVCRTCEFGIFIGDKDYWSKGYGEEAARLILDYGFNILNLNSIYLRVMGYNDRAIRCYEKCGFKLIGRRREAKIVAGKAYDVIYMDILASEFESPYISKLLPGQN